MQRDRLAAVLLHLLHLLDRHVELAGQLVRRGLAAQILQHLALNARQLVDDLDHVHGHADGACLIGHGAGDGLTDPPRGIGGELEALLPVELLDGSDEAQVAFLNQVEEEHATTGVALGQRHHESQVRLQQVVLGLLAVVRRPLELALALEVHAVALGIEQMLGVQAGLDALGEVHLLLGVQQADTANLLEIVLDRIRCGARSDDAALRIARRGQVLVVVIVAHHERALLLGLFRLLAPGFGPLVVLFVLGNVVILTGFVIDAIIVAIQTAVIDIVEIVVKVLQTILIDLDVVEIVRGILVGEFLGLRHLLGLVLDGLRRLGRGALAGGLRGRGCLRRGLACRGLGRGGARRGLLARGGFPARCGLLVCRRGRTRGGSLLLGFRLGVRIVRDCRRHRILRGQTHPPASSCQACLYHIGRTSGKSKSSTM